MKRISGFPVFALIFLFIISSAEAAEPEQIHLAVNGNKGEMVIQWGTIEDTWNFCPSANDVEYFLYYPRLNWNVSDQLPTATRHL